MSGLMTDIAIHFLLGLMFAGTGVIARNWCRHWKHQLAVGLIFIAIESVIAVLTVG
jgi:hypothetical protein